VVVKLRAWFSACIVCASCAASTTPSSLRELAPRGPEKYTVVIFFSADCHVLKAHDERLRELAAEYAGRGVRFVALDPEAGATPAADEEEANRRHYPFPIRIDEGARIAKAARAAYAGHTIVVDREGTVVYRGGIDSDRVHMTDDATPYLRNALADLVGGRAPRVAETKVLGCALRTW
jgi:hypothetical protein